MNLFWLLLEGAWQVLLAGLILGAGIPLVFALGLRSLAWGAADLDDGRDHQPHAIGKLFAYVCFAVVVLAIAMGIGIIVSHGFGMEFNLGWPPFVPR